MVGLTFVDVPSDPEATVVDENLVVSRFIALGWVKWTRFPNILYVAGVCDEAGVQPKKDWLREIGGQSADTLSPAHACDLLRDGSRLGISQQTPPRNPAARVSPRVSIPVPPVADGGVCEADHGLSRGGADDPNGESQLDHPVVKCQPLHADASRSADVGGEPIRSSSSSNFVEAADSYDGTNTQELASKTAVGVSKMLLTSDGSNISPVDSKCSASIEGMCPNGGTDTQELAASKSAVGVSETVVTSDGSNISPPDSKGGASEDRARPPASTSRVVGRDGASSVGTVLQETLAADTVEDSRAAGMNTSGAEGEAGQEKRTRSRSRASSHSSRYDEANFSRSPSGLSPRDDEPNLTYSPSRRRCSPSPQGCQRPPDLADERGGARMFLDAAPRKPRLRMSTSADLPWAEGEGTSSSSITKPSGASPQCHGKSWENEKARQRSQMSLSANTSLLNQWHVREGDWRCRKPSCENSWRLVFGSKTECPRCGCPRDGSEDNGQSDRAEEGRTESSTQDKHAVVLKKNWERPRETKDHEMSVEGSGRMLKAGSKYGFIKQDSGEENLFVLPSACAGFGGNIPSAGTRVVYEASVRQSPTERIQALSVRPGPEDRCEYDMSKRKPGGNAIGKSEKDISYGRVVTIEEDQDRSLHGSARFESETFSVWVGFIGDDVTENDVRRFFTNCGEIKEVQNFENYAIVCFTSKQAQIEAMKLSGEYLGCFQVSVDHPYPKRRRVTLHGRRRSRSKQKRVDEGTGTWQCSRRDRTRSKQDDSYCDTQKRQSSWHDGAQHKVIASAKHDEADGCIQKWQTHRTRPSSRSCSQRRSRTPLLRSARTPLQRRTRERSARRRPERSPLKAEVPPTVNSRLENAEDDANVITSPSEALSCKLKRPPRKKDSPPPLERPRRRGQCSTWEEQACEAPFQNSSLNKEDTTAGWPPEPEEVVPPPAQTPRCLSASEEEMRALKERALALAAAVETPRPGNVDPGDGKTPRPPPPPPPARSIHKRSPVSKTVALPEALHAWAKKSASAKQRARKRRGYGWTERHIRTEKGQHTPYAQSMPPRAESARPANLVRPSDWCNSQSSRNSQSSYSDDGKNYSSESIGGSDDSESCRSDRSPKRSCSGQRGKRESARVVYSDANSTKETFGTICNASRITDSRMVSIVEV